MEFVTIFWIVAMVALILIELFTTNLTTIWFACGACVAVFASVFFPNGIAAQIVVFVAVSAVLVLLTRPLSRKLTSSKAVRTNFDRVIGKKAVVSERIDNLNASGQVRVMGQVWSARAEEDGAVFDIGEIVIVDKIEGVKLIVLGENSAKYAEEPLLINCEL
ncbi:MAG: NfeD family protein [Eubacterium sp.]|jgi:membrane protein implicated in regulation of membrane protease activity|nr:NfeD family protein [Eubacterium sp.]